MKFKREDFFDLAYMIAHVEGSTVADINKIAKRMADVANKKLARFEFVANDFSEMAGFDPKCTKECEACANGLTQAELMAVAANAKLKGE